MVACTISCDFFVSAANEEPVVAPSSPQEKLGNHSWQSQQGRLELGLRLSRRYPGTCHQFSALPLPLR